MKSWPRRNPRRLALHENAQATLGEQPCPCLWGKQPATRSESLFKQSVTRSESRGTTLGQQARHLAPKPTVNCRLSPFGGGKQWRKRGKKDTHAHTPQVVASRNYSHFSGNCKGKCAHGHYRKKKDRVAPVLGSLNPFFTWQANDKKQWEWRCEIHIQAHSLPRNSLLITFEQKLSTIGMPRLLAG